jgi:choline dehydrogenase-like flavoprotein
MSGALVEIGDVAGRATVEDSADVVIVGSGAAGATAARVLTEAGADVILVEEGPHVPAAELRSDLYTGFKRVWREMGAQVAEGRAFIPLLQGRCVGGATAINSAIIHRLPEPIYRLWCEERGVGSILRYDDLARAWDAMDRELSVGEAPDAVLGENNRLMEMGVRALGMRGNRIRRAVKECQGSAHCAQGCPTERRQSMNVSYVPRAIAAGARLYATCAAERIVARDGRAAVVEGRFRDPATGALGPTAIMHARKAVICAASAIQTPLLLRRSKIGRRSRLVGERFQAHPGTAVVGVFEQPVRMWFGATQGYESTHYWERRMKFETIALPPELGAVRLPGLGAALMRSLAEYGHVAQWAVQVRARAHGRVREGRGGRAVIRYDPTDEDVRVLKEGVLRLAEMLFAAGAREVLPGVHGLPDRVRSIDEMRALEALPDDPRRFHCIASHLFGTAVMGLDPASSVVAPDGQAHEMPGLYVADSSVFPTNLGVNPQHSIAGFSWVVAERLANTMFG